MEIIDYIIIFIIIILILKYINNNNLINKEIKGGKKKNYLAFHTIFILNENIDILEEFIIYNINLGFDHFYLYDNEGSIGRNGSTSTKNKYGFKISSINSPRDIEKLNKILTKYNKYITYIKWQPKDKNGNIIYGQNESINHFKNNYCKDNSWVAFMDLDELIFSKKNINLLDYLKDKEKQDYSKLVIYQKKFLDMKLSKEKYMINEYNTISYENNTNQKDTINTYAEKNIIYCPNLIEIKNIHKHFKMKNTNYYIETDLDTLRFNHYNINKKQLEWMENKFKKKYNINEIDNSMKRYKYLLKDL